MKKLWKNLRGSTWFKKWVYKPYESITYCSVKDMLSKREKHGFLYELYRDMRFKVQRVWEWPGDRLRDLKQYHQRGIYGVSDCDCWGLYDYLIDVKIRGLQYIKKYKHGCPCLDGFGEHDGNQTDEEFEAMSKEWDRIIDEMIWTFQTMKKISGHDLMAPGIDKSYFTDIEKKKYQEMCDEWNTDYPQWEKHFVMTEEEFKRYKQGWEYYKIHFMSLWD